VCEMSTFVNLSLIISRVNLGSTGSGALLDSLQRFVQHVLSSDKDHLGLFGESMGTGKELNVPLNESSWSEEDLKDPKKLYEMNVLLNAQREIAEKILDDQWEAK
ncbi:hypothetical protein Tco_1045919, partial [Tanacetum coccineum]